MTDSRAVVVVGATGFIGRHVAATLADAGRRVIGIARSVPHLAAGSWVEIDLTTDAVSADQLGSADVLVWCAGSSDHALPADGTAGQNALNVTALANALQFFEGDVVALSSQAVYEGHTGKVNESTVGLPVNGYARAKVLAELLLSRAVAAGRIRRATVFRLMYTFGRGEQTRRLVPRCVHSALAKAVLTVPGGGRSFVNPLPVEFVAEVLSRETTSVAERAGGIVEFVNLNHPDPWTVLDVVSLVSERVIPVAVNVTMAGESFPVTFFGATERLEARAREWGVPIPSPSSAIVTYANDLTSEV